MHSDRGLDDRVRGHRAGGIYPKKSGDILKIIRRQRHFREATDASRADPIHPEGLGTLRARLPATLLQSAVDAYRAYA